MRKLIVPLVPIVPEAMDEESLLRILRVVLENNGYSPVFAVLDEPDEEEEDAPGREG